MFRISSRKWLLCFRILIASTLFTLRKGIFRTNSLRHKFWWLWCTHRFNNLIYFIWNVSSSLYRKFTCLLKLLYNAKDFFFHDCELRDSMRLLTFSTSAGKWLDLNNNTLCGLIVQRSVVQFIISEYKNSFRLEDEVRLLMVFSCYNKLGFLFGKNSIFRVRISQITDMPVASFSPQEQWGSFWTLTFVRCSFNPQCLLFLCDCG